jgi:hypothetical protein
MPRTAHVRHARRRARYTREEAARIAIGARLATEDWREMTAQASASPRNPANLDRWRAQARKENPALDDEQVERQAERLRSDYYRELGKRSGEARRAADGPR